MSVTPTVPARSASLVLVGLLALALLYFSLLPGLLGACLGFLIAKALLRLGARYCLPAASTLAPAVVIVLPLLALVLALLNAKTLALGAAGQYQALLQFLAQTTVWSQLPH